jgi:catechol 2,3-dioxygenase-like lactoylglutathione lyase family enzyme
MTLSIDHFVLTVQSVEATLSFYERVLGMRREVLPERPVALKFGTQKINVHAVEKPFEPKAYRPTPGAADFCLVTDEPLTAIEQRLTAAGGAIELGPVERIGARGSMMSIYFRDPDANLVEVSRYLDPQ